MKTIYALVYPFLSVVIALIIGFAIIIPILNPPLYDIQFLLVVMSVTGSITVTLSYLLYHQEIMQWFNSLRWTLLATIILTVALVFVNVWVTAQLMFISFHDLILTTALLVFAGLISAFSVYFVSRVIIDRIHELAMAAEKLAQGDLTIRLNARGNDEIAHLAGSFNSMAMALHEVDEQKRMLEQTRRDLIAWVSHDLRTPLAALRAMNEAIVDGVVADPETITRYMNNSQREIKNLNQLIDDLFALSQLDTGRLKLATQDTSLHDLISDTLSSLSARAAANNINLVCHLASDVDVIRAAPDKIQRVLHNLLDNAFTHTPPDGSIILRVASLDEIVNISIHNTGSYIPPEAKDNVFESFYRVEQSRAQGQNGQRGAGLGLAIARGFVEAHGGTIKVESDPQKGTTFTFTLPTAP